MMKKLGLLLLGGIAIVVLLANLVPMVILAISLVVLYFVVKEFLKTRTALSKIMWAVIGLIILCTTVSNVPAVLGLAAAYVLYVVYKKWNQGSELNRREEDPFAAFEKQWAELKRN